MRCISAGASEAYTSTTYTVRTRTELDTAASGCTTDRQFIGDQRIKVIAEQLDAEHIRPHSSALRASSLPTFVNRGRPLSCPDLRIDV